MIDGDDSKDRVKITASGDRAFHFPLLLLTDRSASFRGALWGSHSRRIAAEAFEAMRRMSQLVGMRAVAGRWESREWCSAALCWRRFEPAENSEHIVFSKGGPGAEGDPHRCPMPADISRQSVGQHKLTPESHTNRVDALNELVKRKGYKWELVDVEAEKISKDMQLKAAALTTVRYRWISHLVTSHQPYDSHESLTLIPRSRLRGRSVAATGGRPVGKKKSAQQAACARRQQKKGNRRDESKGMEGNTHIRRSRTIREDNTYMAASPRCPPMSCSSAAAPMGVILYK
ncbi:hypothetical protein B0H13DRAFT_2464844 [Mycena leptocephala]|nr:hypothetical protein B0H13DRAFT_2464844 [Mycena leptocephala]